MNHWPIWVYPPPKSLPIELALYDPGGILNSWEEYIVQMPRVTPNEPSFSHQFLLTTTWNTTLAYHVKAGTRVLLIQSREGPLPVRRCPFWREAIKFFQPHLLWEHFPHSGFTGMQFFGLASDLAFESSGLTLALPRPADVYPLLRRLERANSI